MPTATPNYAAAAALTIGLASLASDTNLVAGRASAYVEQEATDDAVDCLIGGKIRLGTSPTASRVIELWLYGTADDGTTFSGGASGSDANLTPDDKSLLRFLARIPTIATSDKDYRWGPFSVGQAFGGIIPVRWGLYVVHNTGVNLNATSGNHNAYRTPVKFESA